MRPAAIVTDIEGTTSSIRFVKDVLFPYSRERLGAFVAQRGHQPEVRALLDEAAREGGIAGADDAAIVALLLAWIDEDRKATPLKALQAMIWVEGYDGGHFVAHVYDDAVAALRRWHADGIPLYVYSSGAVAAQRLYFAHTTAGDLTPLFAGWFDTRIGSKREDVSYRRIAAEIGAPPAALLFLSDLEAEIEAAEAAGWRAVWVRRDATDPAASGRASVASFDAIVW